jgi:hypothetical protein
MLVNGVGFQTETLPELACRLRKPGPALLSGPRSFAHDPKIKAAVIAAPGFGFSFAPDGLCELTTPVQLWSGEADIDVPYATTPPLCGRRFARKSSFTRFQARDTLRFLRPAAGSDQRCPAEAPKISTARRCIGAQTATWSAFSRLDLEEFRRPDRRGGVRPVGSVLCGVAQPVRRLSVGADRQR